MKFYGRKEQLLELQRIESKAFSNHSRFTVVTGRRRIGKTSLVIQALKEERTLYLFVARKNEALLCADFIEQINSTLGRSIDIYIPSETNTFRSLFALLLDLAKREAFSLVIDEFQEFYTINPSVYSDMQNLWDQNRKKTHMNLVVCGSVYSLMHKIFRDEKEPLFGRADGYIQLNTFDTKTLKEIMGDMNAQYAHDDLLALYSITGGVPKYVELFFDDDAVDLASMLTAMVREGSPFLDEGKTLLLEEFGKNYTTYFSILSALSRGVNTQAGIESSLGDVSIGGHLKRLEEDYGVLERRQPLLAKPNSRAVRFRIVDNFIQFWFRYFEANQSLIEIKNYALLQKRIHEDYFSYSGHILERYFIQQLSESGDFEAIGAWWERNREHNDIDIVALYPKGNRALAIEVKRQMKKFQPELLHKRVEHLRQKILPDYEIEERCLSLEDM